MAWRRTLISLLVVDLFIWRSWIISTAGPGAAPTGVPGLDYQGICALAAAAATVVLAGAAWLRSHQLHLGAVPASTGVVLSCSIAVVGLGAAAVAAIGLGG